MVPTGVPAGGRVVAGHQWGAKQGRVAFLAWKPGVGPLCHGIPLRNVTIWAGNASLLYGAVVVVVVQFGKPASLQE